MVERTLRAPELPGAAQPPAEGWVPTRLPDLWQKHPTHQGGATWYRLDWRYDCPDQPVAVTVDHMVMAAQVFLNGDLLWQDAGLAEPVSRNWNTPRYWLLPRSALGTTNSLMFRLVAPEHPGAGLGNVHFGTPEAMLALHTRQQWEQRGVATVSIFVSLVIAGLFLILWIIRREEQAFGWFALASIMWSIGLSNMLVTSAWPFPSGDIWDRLSLIAFGLYCCAFCMFAWRFGAIRNPLASRLLWLGYGVLSVVIVSIPDAAIGIAQAACALIYKLIFYAVCIQFMAHAWRTRLYDHRVLAGCMFCFLLLGLYSLLADLGLYEAFHGSQPFSAIIISLSMFLVVAARFARSMRRIEAFNSELRDAIAHTRMELTQTLQRKYELEAANIRLNERLGLAHDLHDSMGSSLMRSIILTEQSPNLRQQQFLSMLRELRDDLRHVIDGCSGTTTATTATPGEWVAPLRRRFVELFEELSIASNWSIAAEWPFPVPNAHQVALTRFLEEALTNALKHSHASHLDILVQTREPNVLSVSVRDNGAGFSTAQPKSEMGIGLGIGMESMHLRILRIGGRLDIHSSAEGTSLTVHLCNPQAILQKASVAVA